MERRHQQRVDQGAGANNEQVTRSGQDEELRDQEIVGAQQESVPRHWQRRESKVNDEAVQGKAADIDQDTRSCWYDEDLSGGQGEEMVAQQESRIVFRLKLVLLLLLLLFAVGTAVAVSYYIKEDEDNKFRSQFQGDAFKVLQAIGAIMLKKLEANDGFAVAISSYARAAQQTWPFVTLPDFGIQAAKMLETGASLTINFVPFVKPEQRGEWEEYASGDRDHIGWVNETLAVQESWRNYYGQKDQWGWETHDVIHADFGDVPYNETRIFMPKWQNFPLVSLLEGWPPANYDWSASDAVTADDAILDRRKAVISQPYLLPRPNDPIAEAETEIWADWGANFLEPWENPKEPASEFFYPIFDDYQGSNKEVNQKTTQSLVGMLVGFFYWRTLLRDILPASSVGIVVVFENPCSQAFTYQIDGSHATYLGVGDVHDAKYNYLRIQSKLVDLKRFGVRDSKYSGTPLDTLYCPFTLSVYPSDDMLALHTTNHGIVFALSAVAIFVFTSLVFILYDVYVEKRQKMVKNRAEHSSAIVSSLFPSVVLDQLYESQEKAPKKAERKTRIKAFKRYGNTSGVDISEQKPTLHQTCSPMASLYENTTIMFADLVGFTRWTSSREPSEVFMLLETLFNAFDEIARRRHVFKVETIGDCYVAVTGLPNPQNDHAVIMARFAAECLIQMNKIKVELSSVLGSETAGLALRVGLNSGRAIAGVLRGEKSRFQLFGDTVNTAARMESNSRPNQIMVSQSTADLISRAGKGYWLTPRQDLVEAKGKGAVQCYWCTPSLLGPTTLKVSTQITEVEIEFEGGSNPNPTEPGIEFEGGSNPNPNASDEGSDPNPTKPGIEGSNPNPTDSGIKQEGGSNPNPTEPRMEAEGGSNPNPTEPRMELENGRNTIPIEAGVELGCEVKSCDKSNNDEKAINNMEMQQLEI